MKLRRADGTLWEVGAPVRTSDGYLLATGVQVDEDGTVLRDEDGTPTVHSFFLGSANPNER